MALPQQLADLSHYSRWMGQVDSAATKAAVMDLPALLAIEPLGFKPVGIPGWAVYLEVAKHDYDRECCP